MESGILNAVLLIFIEHPKSWFPEHNKNWTTGSACTCISKSLPANIWPPKPFPLAFSPTLVTVFCLGHPCCLDSFSSFSLFCLSCRYKTFHKTLASENPLPMCAWHIFILDGNTCLCLLFLFWLPKRAHLFCTTSINDWQWSCFPPPISVSFRLTQTICLPPQSREAEFAHMMCHSTKEGNSF